MAAELLILEILNSGLPKLTDDYGDDADADVFF